MSNADINATANTTTIDPDHPVNQKGQPILKFEEAKDEKGQLNGHIDVEMAAGTDPLQNILIGITIDEETTKSR